MLWTLAVGLVIGIAVILVLRLVFRSRRADNVVAVQSQPAAARIPATPSGGSQELDQLWSLHQKGALTAEEFNAAKARVLAGAPTLAGDGLYEAVLTVCGDKKISVIKEVRELTNLGLKEAKDAVEAPPFVLARGLSADQARKIQSDFAAVGAQVEVR